MPLDHTLDYLKQHLIFVFFFSFPLFVNPTNSRNNQINSINANPSHYFKSIKSIWIIKGIVK